MIQRHPDAATLLQYTTGAMPEVLRIVTATHLTFCTDCRVAVADLEMLGGILLEEITPLDVVAAHTPFVVRLPPPILNPDLPAPLNRIPWGSHWWPVGAGFWWRMMRVPGPGFGGLLWGRPGAKLPRHRHHGLELACVLAGSFTDSSGEFFVGDMSDPEAGEHAEVPITVTGSEPCLCVLASEGMHLRGIVGLIQQMFG